MYIKTKGCGNVQALHNYYVNVKQRNIINLRQPKFIAPISSKKSCIRPTLFTSPQLLRPDLNDVLFKYRGLDLSL